MSLNEKSLRNKSSEEIQTSFSELDPTQPARLGIMRSQKIVRGISI